MIQAEVTLPIGGGDVISPESCHWFRVTHKFQKESDQDVCRKNTAKIQPRTQEIKHKYI